MDRVRSDGVGDRGADGAARLVRRAEHEVVDEQLRATVEELGERLRPRLGLEAVVLLDRHPGELPPLPRELVAASGELLLFGEQLLAGRIEFLLCADLVLGHCLSSCMARCMGSSDYIVSKMANDAFKALAHPLRRDIVERLSGGSATVAEVSGDFRVSKPTISRHLRMLEEAGVVSRVID